MPLNYEWESRADVKQEGQQVADSDESKCELMCCGREKEGNINSEKQDYFPVQLYRHEEKENIVI